MYFSCFSISFGVAWLSFPKKNISVNLSADNARWAFFISDTAKCLVQKRRGWSKLWNETYLIIIVILLLTLFYVLFSFMVSSFHSAFNLNLPKTMGFVRFWCFFSCIPLLFSVKAVLLYFFFFQISNLFSPELLFLPFHLIYRKILCIRYSQLTRGFQTFCCMFKAVIENFKLTLFYCFISKIVSTDLMRIYASTSREEMKQRGQGRLGYFCELKMMSFLLTI